MSLNNIKTPPKKLDKPIITLTQDGGNITGNQQYAVELKVWDNQLKGDIIATVSREPFFNCQIYTIGGIDGILGQDSTKYILERIQDSVDKSRLVIDCSNYTDNHDKISTIFSKEDIVFRQDYTNNTGSEMSMYMLKTGPIGYCEGNDEYEDYDYDNDY